MALKKAKEYKGYIGEYWKVTQMTINLMNDTIGYELCLFKDRTARLGGRDNMLTREVSKFTSSKLEAKTTKQKIELVYTEIKKSKMEQKMDEDNLPVVDKKGKIVMEETNWFADSVNVLEVGQKVIGEK